MVVKIFRAVVGAFTFREKEIAELAIEQQMDAQGYRPLAPPETVRRGNLLYIEQSGIRESELIRNKTSEPGR